MSGIAGIIHFDGRPVEPGAIERMTASMARRGPDGIRHWVKGNVALGHCQMCTTPESLEETQPWTNEDESLVLVMDGRVDNWEELRVELLGRGARLRNRSDAELLLRAYEEWGEGCPERIIGEFSFQIWDGRKRIVFGARDAAGTKNFHYHEGAGWFGFASEIKGLRALERIEEKLNEWRVACYLIPALDRMDEVGTCFEGIVRLPAGHAMTAGPNGVKTWRYWDPSGIAELPAKSVDECAEGFAAQFRTAVKCRLRSTRPLAAMLSGGLDSSSVVALILKEYGGLLKGPLHTVTLTECEPERSVEYRHAKEVIALGGCVAHVVDPSQTGRFAEGYWEWAKTQDEPFTADFNHTYQFAYRIAAEQGIRSVLDGMAGDCCMFVAGSYLNLLFRQGKWGLLARELRENRRIYREPISPTFVRQVVLPILPESVRDLGRRMKPMGREPWRDGSIASEALIQRVKVRERIAEMARRAGRGSRTAQAIHGQQFVTGTLSFAQERNSMYAAGFGVETRSPFADRRVMEYAVSMPVEAKLLLPRYKETLRRAMRGVLPELIEGRTEFMHPGPSFIPEACRCLAAEMAELIIASRKEAEGWLDACCAAELPCKAGPEVDGLSQVKRLAVTVFHFWQNRSRCRTARNVGESNSFDEVEMATWK